MRYKEPCLPPGGGGLVSEDKLIKVVHALGHVKAVQLLGPFPPNTRKRQTFGFRSQNTRRCVECAYVVRDQTERPLVTHGLRQNSDHTATGHHTSSIL